MYSQTAEESLEENLLSQIQLLPLITALILSLAIEIFIWICLL